MDKFNRYRKLIQQILSERIDFDNQQATEGVEHFLIADENMIIMSGSRIIRDLKSAGSRRNDSIRYMAFEKIIE